MPPRFSQAHPRTCRLFAEMEGKAEAFQTATAFAETGSVVSRGRTRFALLLSGDVGRGKSWLASSVFGVILHKQTGAKSGRWAKFHKFIREVQACYTPAAKETSDAVLTRYQTTPLLMLDDVGDMDRDHRETEDRVRLLYEVLDYRNDYLLPTILTTNLGPKDLMGQFGQRTWERIYEMSVMCEMAGANMRQAA